MKKISISLSLLFMLISLGNALPSNEKLTKNVNTLVESKEANAFSFAKNIFCEPSKGVYLPYDECKKMPKFKEEMKLMRNLQETFVPLMSENFDSRLGNVNLKEESQKVSFGINHSDKTITENFLAMSAENDMAYNWTQSKYFSDGTIKVFLTKKFLQIYKMYLEMKTFSNEDAIKGFELLFIWVLSHETLHAWQYKMEPSLDINRLPLEDLNKMLIAKNIPQNIYTGSWNYLENEMEAINNLDLKTTKKVYQNPNSLIEQTFKTFTDFSTKNPELFTKDGKYSLLASFDTHYLDKIKTLIETEEFVPYTTEEYAINRGSFTDAKTDYIYNSQIIPLFGLKKLWEISEDGVVLESELELAKKVKTEVDYYLHPSDNFAGILGFLKGFSNHFDMIDKAIKEEMVYIESLVKN